MVNSHIGNLFGILLHTFLCQHVHIYANIMVLGSIVLELQQNRKMSNLENNICALAKVLSNLMILLKRKACNRFYLVNMHKSVKKCSFCVKSFLSGGHGRTYVRTNIRSHCIMPLHR